MYRDGTYSTELNLSAVRRSRGLSLRDIADLTKIGTPYLRAIEYEQFDDLPGLIYSVSYIRQYASAIGYDADSILRLCRKANSAELTPELREADDLLKVVRLHGGRCWRAIAGFVLVLL